MKTYLELLENVYQNGTDRLDRTGTGTRSIFGAQVRYRLEEGFPLLTTKKLFFRGIVQELLWFLAGSSNVRALQAEGVHIWDQWADESGDLGPIYGKQWRGWRGADGKTTDQMTKLLEDIKQAPDSRRLLVSAWNVGELEEMALPPCHTLMQFYVDRGRLSCQLYQRSGDLFLGVPFNIASYALLTEMIAQVTGFKPGEFIHTFGDLHIYKNHFEQVELQLTREPRERPRLRLEPEINDLFAFRAEHIRLENYDPHPPIPGKVAV